MCIKRKRVQSDVPALAGNGIRRIQAVVVEIPAILLVKHIDRILLSTGIFHLRIPAENNLIAVDRLNKHARLPRGLFDK